MKFSKKILVFSFIILLYPAFSFASYTETDWQNGSYKISHKKVSFSKTKPFSSRDREVKASPSYLEYFGGVAAPVVDGDTLHAVDVIAPMNEKQIFSAYNFRGNIKKGAIQLIEIDGDNIYTNSEITFYDSDVNAIYRYEEKLYFAGSDANGAFFSHAIIQNKKFAQIGYKIYISGYVATDIMRANHSVYITTADNGGLYSFFSELASANWFKELFAARSIYAADSERMVYVLSGQPAKLYQLNKSGQLIHTLEIGGALTPESKSFLTKSGNYIYATVGEAGLKIICNNNIVGELESVILPGFDPSKTVTNALAIDKKLIFTASGEAGLYMYEKNVTLTGKSLAACTPVTFEEKDHFNYWPEVSANHVALKEGFAFVASGAYGIQAFEVK